MATANPSKRDGARPPSKRCSSGTGRPRARATALVLKHSTMRTEKEQRRTTRGGEVGSSRGAIDAVYLLLLRIRELVHQCFSHPRQKREC